MAIIGLTDRGASFPRIGELRKGGAKPATGNKPGPDLKHFRFTSTDIEVLSKFTAVYGSEPRVVHCFLPYQTADENFEAWIEEWGAGSLKWRGDGKNLVMWQKPDGTFSQERKAQPTGGKQVGRLKVILPTLGRLAYVVALTTSLHDILEIHANLTAFEALRGDLRGIPFILSRVPRMISTPSNDGRVRREKWLLHIEAAPEWVQAQLSVMEREALPGGGALMLDVGDIEPDDDGIDYETGEIVESEPVCPFAVNDTVKAIKTGKQWTVTAVLSADEVEVVNGDGVAYVVSCDKLELVTKATSTPATQQAAFDSLPSASGAFDSE